MFKHEHPLNLIDLWSKQEKEFEEDKKENHDDLTAKHDFRCLCSRCDEEINWFHRYYYTCGQCKYSIHKFCAELPEKLENIYHDHTLYLVQQNIGWRCDICGAHHEGFDLRYRCSTCDFDVDVKCATKGMLKNTIHHPSHKHPLVCMTRRILTECDACGKKHEGIFYRCTICPDSFIHNDCAFLPKKLQIQHTTNGFSHSHPLTLSYSFPMADQRSKSNPRCRVCHQAFSNDKLWIYKCEECNYYTHLSCATSRNEPIMSNLTTPDLTQIQAGASESTSSPGGKAELKMDTVDMAKAKAAMDEGLSSYLHPGDYPPVSDFDPDTLTAVHMPEWDVLQGSNFSHSQVIEEFVKKAIPPGERVARASQSIQELSLAGTTHVAGLFSVYVELIYRQRYDDKRIQSMHKEIQQLHDAKALLEVNIDKYKSEVRHCECRRMQDLTDHTKAIEMNQKVLKRQKAELEVVKGEVERLKTVVAKKDTQLALKASHPT